MKAYCGNQSSLSPEWIDDGFSPCFYNTLAASLLLFMALLPLPIQIHIMRRHGAEVESKARFLFVLQWIVLLVLLVETPIRFALDWAKVHTGVQIFYLLVRLLMIPLTIVLFHLERTSVLLDSKSKRHSIVLIVSMTLLLLIETVCVFSWHSELWWFQNNSPEDKLGYALWMTRLVCVSVSFFLTISRCAPGIDADSETEVENESLLRSRHAEKQNSSQVRSTWGSVKAKLKLLWPYVWPEGNVRLKVHVVFCFACLIAGRVVNVYVPILYKYIVNALAAGQSWNYIMHLIAIYIVLKFLQGGGLAGGLLNGIQLYLWIPVQQFTNRKVQTKLISHLHALSLRWHISRKTGEVLRSIDRGTISQNAVLQHLFFNIMPMLADVLVAIVYFLTSFNPWFALIVFVCISSYLVDTVLITEWRSKYRRDMNTKDNRAKQRAIDSLLNFETVKYYNAESYEVRKYDNAILEYQKSEWICNALLALLNTSQSAIINTGLLVGSVLCAKFVMDGTLQVGDYVLFGTYIVQLYTPLNFFGTYYRMLQSNFIDMENMFDLFDEDPEVQDSPDAITLKVQEKSVEFDNVSFSYQPEKQILKNVSFKVNPGETVALVGPSGAGKSTVIRLLFRFYDIQSGVIRIDGTDISTVTQESLRNYIGVVPQDTVLFNEEILENIRYGRVTASDAEVHEAAKAAEIHNTVVSFPKGYETTVGERGLKLSGGEKQRVAIARTILKAPDFVLLDEATSSLDTKTERNIVASLDKISVGKTTIVVAHRLSTIVNADRILVLQDGEIKERGSHEELLQLDGIYNEMWSQQLSESENSGKEQSSSSNEIE